MKLVMTLLVRDEEDVLDAHLRYHFAQGVDFMVVTNNRSVDGTGAILQRYEQDGAIHVIDEPEDDYSQWRWVTRMARMACTEYQADWVINADADEFWWPEQGDLKSTLAAVPEDADVVHVERFDFVPVPEDGRPFYQRMVVRETISLNLEGEPLPRKVAHRAHPEVTVAQGNHKVTGPSMVSAAGPVPLVIHHFPLRTYSQFRNKIVKGGSAYRRNRELPAEVGAGWRNLFKLYEEGALEEFYRDQELSPDQIAAGVASSDLVPDERLLHFMQELDAATG